MQSREEAEAEITRLEQQLEHRLSEVPMHLVDQWGAGVRDMLRELGVEKLDKAASRAALGGAYLVATLTLSGALVVQPNLEATAHVLRWLYDRGEDDG